MDLKNALSICLISLFSATLVVLIARSLDSAAAARLAPELERIANELEALRTSGGIASSPTTTSNNRSSNDGLTVYFFHGNTRCVTCRAIEAQTHETLRTDFAEQLKDGAITWRTRNYEEPASSELTRTFEIQMSVIVLARMQDGQIKDWQRLDQVWALVGDKPAFAKFIRTEVRKMLDARESEPTNPVPTNPVPTNPVPTNPVPTTKEDPAPDVPIPQGDLNQLPLPD